MHGVCWNGEMFGEHFVTEWKVFWRLKRTRRVQLVFIIYFMNLRNKSCCPACGPPLFCIRWLTFIQEDDSFLRRSWSCSAARLGTQQKLVAFAVLEVGQSDGGLVGGQCQLLLWAQLIGVIDYRGETWVTAEMGWKKLESSKLNKEKDGGVGCMKCEKSENNRGCRIQEVKR